MHVSQALLITVLMLAQGPLNAQEVTSHSSIFKTVMPKPTSGLNLNSSSNDQNQALSELAPTELETLGLPSRFELRQKNFEGLSLQGEKHIESIAYGFNLDGVPLCDIEVKMHRSLDGLTTLMGEIPKTSQKSFKSTDWATPDQLTKITVETLMVSSMGPDYTVVSSEQCIWAGAAELKPVWKTILQSGGLDYEIVTDGDEVFRFEARHFQETGSAEVYATNRNEGSPEAISLRNMDATQRLSNSFFVVCMPSASGTILCDPSQGTPAAGPFAQESNYTFNYNIDSESNKFIQASVFAHSNVALEWLEQHGYKNFGSKRIRLQAHAIFSGNDVNNALYQPGSGVNLPMILVGDGDGDILKNLGTDADVVSHELGHHVIFNTVTQLGGESLVIHEALADYFTFARTGNACLGESICPDTPFGRSVCVVPTQCLRSGENTLSYTDADLPVEPHQRGQFITGMLWDLYEKDKIPLDDVTSLVMKGIDLLVSNSGYKHLVVSLMLVDHAEYSNKYCAKIMARAKTRGLGTILGDVTCESIAAGTSEKDNVTTYSTTATPAVASKKSSSKSCGALSMGMDGESGAAGLLAVLSLPLMITFVRRRP